MHVLGIIPCQFGEALGKVGDFGVLGGHMQRQGGGTGVDHEGLQADEAFDGGGVLGGLGGRRLSLLVGLAHLLLVPFPRRLRLLYVRSFSHLPLSTFRGEVG
jgi:hypothetical protein